MGGAYSAAFVAAFRDLFDGQRTYYAEPDGARYHGVAAPITDEVVRDHLEGRRRLGVFPISGPKQDHCTWIFADVTGPDWELAAALARRLKDGYGVDAYVERSKAAGWHVWVFFASWVACWKARRVVEMAIDDLKDRVTVPIYLAPEQDAIPDAPEELHGRFAWLPMFGGDVAQGRTCFHAPTRGGAPELVKGWDPARAVRNRSHHLDELLDGYEHRIAETAYQRGDDESPTERRVAALHPCATRVLRDGARGEAVPEWAKRLAIHFRRSGYAMASTLAVVSDWNDRLCVPPMPADALRATVEAMHAPTNRGEGLGCEDAHVQAFCAKAECPVWRLALARKNGAAKVEDPNGVHLLKVDERTGEFWFERGALLYHVANLDNRRGPIQCLMVVTRDGTLVHRGTANLDSARSRNDWERKVHDATKLGGAAIDMASMANGIAKHLGERAKAQRERQSEGEQNYVITDAEAAEVSRWQHANPNVLYHMIEDTSKWGMTREKANRILVYLVGTSRKMQSPISAIGKGDSGGGKTFLAQSIFKLMPEEDVQEFTRITGAALFYGDEFALKHRIFFVKEAPGSEGSEHSLRTFMTDGDMKLSTVEKDESGHHTTVERTVRGPMAFYTTTTQVEINPENETRLLQIHCDMEQGTTKAIHRVRAYVAKHGDIEPDPSVLRRWRNFQRKLEKGLTVVVPYSEDLVDDFPDNNLRSRRDFERFLGLIKVCAYLHQHHRGRQPYVDVNGQPREHVVASVADYAIVKRVVEGSMMRSAYDVKAGQERLIESLQGITEGALLDHKAGRGTYANVEVLSDGDGTVVWVGAPALKEKLGTTARAVRDLVHALEEQGIVATHPKSRLIKVRLLSAAPESLMTLKTKDPKLLFEQYPGDRKHMYDPLAAPDFDDVYAKKGRK